MKFENRKVTVMGLGTHHGASAAVRYLVNQGARLTVTDLADANTLQTSLDQIADLDIQRICLTQHEAVDFVDADILVVNPAVKPNNAFVQLAIDNGALITTEIDLFLSACPAKIIAITGTNGKTTTASMLDNILQHTDRNVFLGGNIGKSLLADLPNMTADDVVVLELSSFQLAQMGKPKPCFHVAIVTNCHPNHLDWHGDYEAYIAAKQRIFSFLSPTGSAIVNPNEQELSCWMNSDELANLSNQKVQPLVRSESIPKLQIPGKHNQQNAQLAATAAKLIGCIPQEITAGLQSFTGIAHRIEKVASQTDRDFYDDSKSTTPQATIAAMAAMDRPFWVLVGGKDKGGEFEPLLDSIMNHAQGVAFYGETANDWTTRFKQLSHNMPCYSTENLELATSWCWQNSKPGEAILFSPACASFDQYRDYVHRAEHFRSLIQQLKPASTP